MNIEAQLKHLDGALLSTVKTQFPDPFSEEEKAQIHAYLVLAHAVLEEYLEFLFEQHFQRLASWLEADRVPAECLGLVFAVAQYKMDNPVPYRKRDVAGLVAGLGKKEFHRLVRSNNGLKTSNVEGLAKLVGVRWEPLERELNLVLSDLDTLGVKRGAAGHLSPYTEKTTDISLSDGPDDVRKWVEDGRKAIEAISKYLRDLVRNQEPLSLIHDWDGN
ncbi:HEPN domain-containing protein [Cellulosimicrobium funkei]